MADIDHEMERIGRIVAADQGLDVSVRGVMAYATPGKITIPNVEHLSWLGSNAHRMLHGMLDHEAGHALDTDFAAMEAWKKSKKPVPALFHLWNVLEDGYIEARQGMRYYGSGQNIRRMNEWFHTGDQDGDKFPCLEDRVKGEDQWSAFLSALGPCVAPHGSRSIEFFKRIAPAIYAMLKKCEREIEEVNALAAEGPEQTSKIIKIAERIFAKFAHPEEGDDEGDDEGDEPREGEGDEPREGDQPRKGKGKRKRGGKSKSGEGDEPGDDDDEGDDEGEGDEPGDDGDDEGDDDDDDDDKILEGERTMDLERWSAGGGKPFRAVDQVNTEIRNVFELPPHVQPYTTFSREFDIERDFSIEDTRSLAAAFESESEIARAASETLAQTFESALRAFKLARPVGGNDEGEVDPELLPQFAVGSVPVDQMYIQMVADDSDDVAVSVLVDCSGSMCGSKADLARKAAIALNMALHQNQIAHEVTGFTTTQSDYASSHEWSKGMVAEHEAIFDRMREALNEAEAKGTDVDGFARELCRYGYGDGSSRSAALMSPFHAIFKSFDSDEARGLMHIAGLAENLDGEAVLWQALRLAKRPEARKVMFVLSDGHPAGSRDNAQGARYLKEVIQRVIDSGIEVYGLGIQSKAVCEFYPEWWVCQDLADLSTIALESLTEVLTRNRTERGRIFLTG
jgi:cobalamin biosynthesis protein CobT